MARLASDLSSRLCGVRICPCWTVIRGFANSSSVPPLPSFSERDNRGFLAFRDIQNSLLICSEIYSTVGKPVKRCSTEDFLKAPESSLGAQVVAPEHPVHLIASLLPLGRPSIGLKFAGADEHLVLIRRLAEPSVIGVASVSKTFLRTARG